MSKPSFRSIHSPKSIFVSTSIIHGVMMSLIISMVTNFIVLFIFSILLNFMKGPGPMIQLCTKTAWVIGMFFGGFSMGRNRKNKGWLWGLAGGSSYLIFGVILSLFVSREIGFNSGTLNLMISGLFAGILGGIISINSGYNKETNIRSALQ